MRDGKNANYRNDAERETGTPEKVSDVLSTDVSRHVAWTLDSGMGAVSAAFESALDRVVETWGKYRRIWLVRHFDYEDSEEAREYLEKSKRDKSKMNEDELKALNELSKKVRANVDDPFIQRIIAGSLRKRPDDTKASLYLDAEESIAARNKMTYEWVGNSEELKNRFVTKRFKITTQKIDDTGEKTFRAFSEIKDVLNDWIADEDGGDGVIFGNRTPSHAFWIRVWRPCYSEKDHTDQMERLGYDFLDVEKATGKPLLIQSGKTLRVTLENLGGIEKAILDACENAERKAKISKAFSELPLIMLQEATNEVIAELEKTDRAQYLAVLRSLCEWKDSKGKHDPELQSYVFERLVENRFPWETLLQWEWSTGALEWMATKGYREMVIRYFWESEEGPTGDLGPFAKSINVKGMKELFADAHEYWKIRQRQRRSVDPAIREGRDEGIIQRRAILVESDSETDGSAVSENKRGLFEYGNVFEQSRESNVALCWKTGEGKSIWLTEFAKWAVISQKKVRFLDAKAIEPERLQTGWDLREELENPDFVLCVDAIDEIRNSEKRMKIQTLLAKIGKRCVITSRPSEMEGFRTSTARMELVRIDAEKFVSARTSGPSEMRKVLNSLRKMGIMERFHNSPLILSFACLLAHDLDKGTDTKVQLIERIARYVLSKHAKESKGQDAIDEDVDEWMDRLGKYAFDKYLWEEKIERSPYFDAHLALLFKEGQDGAYEFVHKIFYEHFLARHVAAAEAPADIVIWWKRSVRGTDGIPDRKAWKSHIPAIDSTIQILVEKKEWWKIGEIAHELITDPDDDQTGTGFFLWLEILENATRRPGSDLDEYKRFAYSEISNWTEEDLAMKLPNLQGFLHRNGYPEIPEIDSHVIPMLRSLNGKDVTKTIFQDEPEAEKISRIGMRTWSVELRFKSPEEIDREYADSVLRYAKNWALGSKTWLPIPSKKLWSDAMQNVISSLWIGSSANETLQLLRQLKSPPDSPFIRKSWNDYRISLIANFAKAYEKFRIAGKMDPEDVPLLLREVNAKNPRQIVLAVNDAISINDPTIWKSGVFELLKAYFGFRRPEGTLDPIAFPGKPYEPLEEISADCAELLMKMWVDVREISLTGNPTDDLESLRDLTDAEIFESGFSRDFGTYSRLHPKKPDAYAWIPKKKRHVRSLTRGGREGYRIKGEPLELFGLIDQCVKNGNLAEAIRISQCAYRYYEISYA